MADDDDDDKPIRGEVRLAGYRRVSHGLAVRDRDGLTEEEEFRRDLRAYQLVLPKSAVFTHLTGARLLGWRLPKLPEQMPVFVAVDGDEPRPRRHGLICSRLVRTRRPLIVHGLPVEAPEEILLRAARDLGTLDMVILIDSALAKGHLDPKRMEELLATKRPGVCMLRSAYKLACAKRQSAGESLLGVYHESIEVPVKPQAEIFDDHGNFLARVDFLVLGTYLLHEYDGEHHRGKVQHRTDLRRERGWVGTPYERRGFTLDDLLNHPGVVMHEIDRSLGRPHRLQRLARWKRLVDNSLYSERGRARVMNRWRRQGGIADWSRTA